MPRKQPLTRLSFEQCETRRMFAGDTAELDGDLLALPQPIAGDIDLNGVVDFSDFLTFAQNFGQSNANGATGDFNEDGAIDFADFLVLSRNFGEVTPTLEEIQSASVADREIRSTGFEDFKAATALPNISPVFEQATDNDLVVSYNNMLDPEGLTAVVLKPRMNDIVYEIPIPAAGANVFEHLKDHFDDALRLQATTILFPENHVFEIVPPNPRGRHLKLEGFTDAVIDLNGSTLKLTQISPGVLIEDSQRLTIRNGSIRGHGILASIAEVVPDDSPVGFAFQLLPEYQAMFTASGALPNVHTIGSAELAPLDTASNDVVNDSAGSSSGEPADRWRFKIEGYEELFVNRGTTTNNFVYDTLRGTVRAVSRLAGNFPFEVGDHVWIQHENNIAPGIFLDNEAGSGIEDITLEQLSISNIAGMQIVGEVVRGLHIDGVRIEADPTDPTAFLAGASDGIHINNNGGDIVIENSYLGPNGDDKITIKGDYWQLTAIDAATNQVTIEPVDRNKSVTRWGNAGNRITFIDDEFGVLGTTTLAENSIRDSSKRHLAVLAEIPENVGVGSIIANVDNSGGRVVIRNNELSETRAQAVLVQTSHVVVENNQISGIIGPAIKLNLALHKWYESVNVTNVLVKDNLFSRSSQSVAKSNELITIFQIDRCLRLVEIIDDVLIAGNLLVADALFPDTTGAEATEPGVQDTLDTLAGR